MKAWPSGINPARFHLCQILNGLKNPKSSPYYLLSLHQFLGSKSWICTFSASRLIKLLDKYWLKFDEIGGKWKPRALSFRLYQIYIAKVNPRLNMRIKVHFINNDRPFILTSSVKKTWLDLSNRRDFWNGSTLDGYWMISVTIFRNSTRTAVREPFSGKKQKQNLSSDSIFPSFFLLLETCP